jgi:hypothetical protein
MSDFAGARLFYRTADPICLEEPPHHRRAVSDGAMKVKVRHTDRAMYMHI